MLEWLTRPATIIENEAPPGAPSEFIIAISMMPRGQLCLYLRTCKGACWGGGAPPFLPSFDLSSCLTWSEVLHGLLLLDLLFSLQGKPYSSPPLALAWAGTSLVGAWTPLCLSTTPLPLPPLGTLCAKQRAPWRPPVPSLSKW